MTSGLEGQVIERFMGSGVPKDKISLVRDTFTFRFPRSPAEFVDEFRSFYGPTMSIDGIKALIDRRPVLSTPCPPRTVFQKGHP